MTALLEVRGVVKSFGGVQALAGCSFAVEEGTIAGLIGPNGSGKTTAFNVVTGYQRADAGSVLLDGRDITAAGPGRVCGLGIGRTFQLTRVFPRLTLLENLRVGRAGLPRARARELYTEARCLELLAFFDLAAHAREPVGTLSYGQRKLAELAMVLAREPRLVLLDEPTGGINPLLIGQLGGHIRELNQRGVTFLVVEHNMEFVMDLCETLWVMERGAVIAHGEPEQARRDPRVLDAYLGGALEDEDETDETDETGPVDGTGPQDGTATVDEPGQRGAAR